MLRNVLRNAVDEGQWSQKFSSQMSLIDDERRPVNRSDTPSPHKTKKNQPNVLEKP
jgi:hypothetical protein